MSAPGETASSQLDRETRPLGPGAGALREPVAGRARAAPARGRRAAERGLTIAVGLCAAGPVIASTVRALRDGWVPAGDQANIATRAYDVFTSHTPLVGLHSDASFVLNHAVYSLGPMLFWLLALPARLGSPATLTLTMGIVNTLAIIGVVALARRRGGRVLMFVVAVAVALMCRSLASEVFHDVWNPSAGLFPFTLLIFLCWSLACGEYRLLPLTVLTASFVIQCQLAFLPPALGLLAVGLGGLVVSRAGALRTRWTLAAVLVALVCWAPPLIDQVEHRPGNLTEVVRAATTPKATLGASVGWRAVAHAIGVPPWWLTRPRSPWERKFEVRTRLTTLAGVSTVLILCALLAVAGVGVRRRRADLLAGALIALILCVALAVVAATTPTKPVLAATLGYTMWWGSPAGMFVWVVLIWSALALPITRVLARERRPSSARDRVLASVVGLGLAAVAGTAVAAAENPDYHLPEYRPLKTMYAGLARDVPRGRTVRLLGSLGNATFRFKMAARFALLRRGIRPLSPGSDTRLGSWYELGRHPYDCTVYVDDGSRRPARRAGVVARVTYVEAAVGYPVSIWVSPTGCPGSARVSR